MWTPAWWGWENGAYIFHDGFWGPEVGWYGGIDYGFGYFGHGFYGGRWDRDRFYYNTAVVRVNETVIHNVYVDRTVIRNVNIVNNNHVSYNGGQGGINARPTPEEERASQGRHFPPAQAQLERRQMARSNPEMRASANQGRPAIAATARPTEFKGSGVVPARAAGAPYHPPANRGSGRPGNEPGAGGETARPAPPNQPYPGHARDLPPHQAAPSPGNSQADQKYQQQQQKLMEKQNREHQRLQQQQEKEDQRAQQQRWNEEKRQQTEQRHQQQTQQMEQRHQQQQERAQPRPAERPPERPAERPPERPAERPPHK